MTMTPGIRPADPDNLSLSQRLSYPMDAQPGDQWVYSSLPPNLLSMIIQDATGQSLASFFNSQIAGQVGAAPLVWKTLSGGYTEGAAGAEVAARDLARIAYLALRDGRWHDGSELRQVVGAGHTTTITENPDFLPGTPFRESPGSQFELTSDSPNHYGYYWWTNRTETALGDSVPTDAFYMHGYFDNLAIVVPSKDLVVVRLAGDGPPTDPDFRGEFMEDVMAAVLPEPSGGLFAGAALLFGLAWRRRRHFCVT